MQTFILKFTNGQETRRLQPDQQYPDEIYALMAGKRWAPLVFKQHWNKVQNQSQWAISVHSAKGTLLLKQPFVAV